MVATPQAQSSPQGNCFRSATPQGRFAQSWPRSNFSHSFGVAQPIRSQASERVGMTRFGSVPFVCYTKNKCKRREPSNIWSTGGPQVQRGICSSLACLMKFSKVKLQSNLGYESELYEILDYTNFLPGPVGIPSYTLKVWVVRKFELYECFRRSLAIRITQVWL